MKMSMESTVNISTQTAAMLTGKSVRTINNWLENGTITGSRVQVDRGPGGLMWQIGLFGIAAHIPIDLTADSITEIARADAGDADGINNVGTCFYRSKEYRIAVGWFEAAAKKGHADAMELLSMCYVNGLGVEKNQVLGVQWLGKAAALGHSVAKAKLQALGFEV